MVVVDGLTVEVVRVVGWAVVVEVVVEAVEPSENQLRATSSAWTGMLWTTPWAVMAWKLGP